MGVTARVERRSSGKLGKIMASLKGPTEVKVGFPKGKADGDIIDRAIYNEFGTTRIPARPFLRNAMASNRTKYKSGMHKAAKSLLAGSTSLPIVLNKLGIMAQGDIQGEITSLRNPANAPSTTRQKGSSNPLIDTGQMRGAVTWKINT